MTGTQTLNRTVTLPSLRLLERLELILETLAGMPASQRTRVETNRALAARGQDLLDEAELRALEALGRAPSAG